MFNIKALASLGKSTGGKGLFGNAGPSFRPGGQYNFLDNLLGADRAAALRSSAAQSQPAASPKPKPRPVTPTTPLTKSVNDTWGVPAGAGDPEEEEEMAGLSSLYRHMNRNEQGGYDEAPEGMIRIPGTGHALSRAGLGAGLQSLGSAMGGIGTNAYGPPPRHYGGLPPRRFY